MNFPDIEQVVSETLANQIKAARTPSAVANIESVLNQWLTATRTRDVPDLESRLADFRKRIGVLARSVALACVDNQIVVRATGDAETTLRMIKRGTDWFDPAEDVDKLIAGAMLSK